MDKEEKNLNDVTLDDTQELIYDQDIGQEYRIENEFINDENIEISVKEKKFADEISSDKKNHHYFKNLIMIFAFLAIAILLILIINSIFKKNNIQNNKPIIKLIGEEVIVLSVGDKYIEPGYLAFDQEDGNITNNVNVIGDVNTNEAGIYTLKYKVSDNSNIVETTRNVIVKSKENDFTFNLKGQEIVFVEINGTLIEEGYEAFYDNEDISESVQTFDDLDRSQAGIYHIYYVLKKENLAVLKRTIVVYNGEELDSDADLITELSNWLIDDIHYSNKISLENVKPSALLYFGFLNCQVENNQINHEEMISCLKKIFNVTELNIPLETVYNDKNTSIIYDFSNNYWTINNLNLERPKASIIKVINNNDMINIYESYAYGVNINNEEICDGSNNKMYYSSVDKTELLGYESCNFSCDDDNCHEKVIIKNYKTVFYVHTFKQINNKYYWVSTEKIK